MDSRFSDDNILRAEWDAIHRAEQDEKARAHGYYNVQNDWQPKTHTCVCGAKFQMSWLDKDWHKHRAMSEYYDERGRVHYEFTCQVVNKKWSGW